VATLTIGGKKYRVYNVVLTGTTVAPRKKVVAAFGKRGINVQGGVQLTTDLLIIGTRPGRTKVGKARDLGVPAVLSEDLVRSMGKGIAPKTPSAGRKAIGVMKPKPKRLSAAQLDKEIDTALREIAKDDPWLAAELKKEGAREKHGWPKKPKRRTTKKAAKKSARRTSRKPSAAKKRHLAPKDAAAAQFGGAAAGPGPGTTTRRFVKKQLGGKKRRTSKKKAPAKKAPARRTSRKKAPAKKRAIRKAPAKRRTSKLKEFFWEDNDGRYGVVKASSKTDAKSRIMKRGKRGVKIRTRIPSWY